MQNHSHYPFQSFETYPQYPFTAAPQSSSSHHDDSQQAVYNSYPAPTQRWQPTSVPVYPSSHPNPNQQPNDHSQQPQSHYPSMGVVGGYMNQPHSMQHRPSGVSSHIYDQSPDDLMTSHPQSQQQAPTMVIDDDDEKSQSGSSSDSSSGSDTPRKPRSKKDKKESAKTETKPTTRKQKTQRFNDVFTDRILARMVDEKGDPIPPKQKRARKPATVAPELKAERSQKHNEAEVRRRQRLNNLLLELAMLIGCRKPQKSAILKLAIEKIHEWTDRMKELEQTVTDLRRQLDESANGGSCGSCGRKASKSSKSERAERERTERDRTERAEQRADRASRLPSRSSEQAQTAEQSMHISQPLAQPAIQPVSVQVVHPVAVFPSAPSVAPAHIPSGTSTTDADSSPASHMDGILPITSPLPMFSNLQSFDDLTHQSINQSIKGEDMLHAPYHNHHFATPTPINTALEPHMFLTSPVHPRRHTRAFETDSIPVHQTINQSTKQTIVSILKDSTIPMDLIDLNGQILACNSAFSQMTGYTIEELVDNVGVNDSPLAKGSTIFNLTHRDSFEASFSLLAELITNSHQVARACKKYVHKSGSTYNVALTSWMITDEQGNATYVCTTFEPAHLPVLTHHPAMLQQQPVNQSVNQHQHMSSMNQHNMSVQQHAMHQVELHH